MSLSWSLPTSPSPRRLQPSSEKRLMHLVSQLGHLAPDIWSPLRRVLLVRSHLYASAGTLCPLQSLSPPGRVTKMDKLWLLRAPFSGSLLTFLLLLIHNLRTYVTWPVSLQLFTCSCMNFWTLSSLLLTSERPCHHHRCHLTITFVIWNNIYWAPVLDDPVTRLSVGWRYDKAGPSQNNSVNSLKELDVTFLKFWSIKVVFTRTKMPLLVWLTFLNYLAFILIF